MSDTDVVITMRVADLKAQLEKHGLSVKGLKAELSVRLLEHLAAISPSKLHIPSAQPYDSTLNTPPNSTVPENASSRALATIEDSSAGMVTLFINYVNL